MIDNLTIGLLFSIKDIQFMKSWFDNHNGLAKEIIIGEDSREPSIYRDMFPDGNFFCNPLGNDFAKGRNNILERCTTEWMLFLDADELLSPESKPRLKNLVETYQGDIEVFNFYRLNIFNRHFISYPNYHACLMKSDIRYINYSPSYNSSPGCHERPKSLKTANVELQIIHLKEDWNGNFRHKGYKDSENESAIKRLKQEIEQTK